MHMTDMLLDDYRRIWESMLMAQHDMARHWQRAYLSTRPGVAGQLEWDKDLQRRWREFVMETLNRQRGLVDSACGMSGKTLERTWRIEDAKSPEEFRQAMDEFWSHTFTTLKEGSEARLRDFYSMAGTMYDLCRKSAMA
jgi:hypothetical protein